MNMRRMQFLLVSVVLALGAFGPKAQASAVLELIPDNTGPYFGGESLTVDVWLHNEIEWDFHVWVVQLDFTDSDPALMLSPSFSFDLSTSTRPQDFQILPGLPITSAQNWLEYGCDECRLQLPRNGSLHVGNIVLQLPTDPGAYLLDTLNGDDPLWEHGALVVVQGSTAWRAYTGEITGGFHEFDVIPEPATLSMLMLGAATFLGRGQR